MTRICKRISDGIAIMRSNEVTKKNIEHFDQTAIDITVVAEFENGEQRLLVVVLDKSDSDTFKQLVKSLPETERNSFEWEENSCTCQLEFDAYWAYWTYKLAAVANEKETIDEVLNEASGCGHDAERVLRQVMVKALRKGLEG